MSIAPKTYQPSGEGGREGRRTTTGGGAATGVASTVAVSVSVATAAALGSGRRKRMAPMAMAISAMTANSTPPRAAAVDLDDPRRDVEHQDDRERDQTKHQRPSASNAADDALDDRLVVRVGRDQQPGEQVEPEAEPVEHHQPDEADADEERVDVEVVGEAAGNAAQDAVVAAAPKEAWGGGLFSRHARMIGRQERRRPLGKSPIGP